MPPIGLIDQDLLPKTPKPPRAPEALFGDWHQDLKTSTDQRSIFVPRSVDLGPARFRRTLHFGRDGVFTMLRLDPGDAHYECTGTFAAVAADLLDAQCKDPKTQETFDVSIRILQASRDRLALQMPSNLDSRAPRKAI